MNTLFTRWEVIMRRTREFTLAAGLVAVALAVPALSGCGTGGEAGGDAEEEAAPAVRVDIVEPAGGATVAGPDVRVRLEVTGIEIAPIAEARPGTAHHHLFLDRDLTPWGEMIPLDNPQIVHMGDGRSEHTFTGLAAGPHRVIAVLADPAHFPLDPPVADTVSFTVGG